MPDNQDKDVPKAGTQTNSPVQNDSFDSKDKIPIFWGPGQLTTYPDYSPPVDWHGPEPLNIPKVLRFIYAAQGSYDSDAYPKAGGGGGDSPYYTITEVRDHLPPFPTSFAVVVRYSFTGLDSIYTTPAFVVDPSTLLAVDVRGHFTVGLKYRVTYPATAALNYLIGGTHGDGFYARSTGEFITPF